MRKSPKKIPEFLTDPEVKALLRVPDRRTLQGKRDYAILKLLVNSGLRKAELCSLAIGDLQPYRNNIVLTVRGKGGKARRIALHPEVLSALKEYWKAAGAEPDPERPLFSTLGKHGPYGIKPLTRVAVDHLVRRAAREALVRKRITPHSLRHTFATLMLDRGEGLRAVQGLMGHSSIRTTERYLHASDDMMVEAVCRHVF